MDKKFCDICGEFITRTEQFGQIKQLQIVMTQQGPVASPKELDVCEKCITSLMMHIEGMKKEAEKAQFKN